MAAEAQPQARERTLTGVDLRCRLATWRCIIIDAGAWLAMSPHPVMPVHLDS